MKPETKEAILRVVDKVLADLAKALGLPGNDEVLQFLSEGFQEHGQEVAPLAEAFGAKLVGPPALASTKGEFLLKHIHVMRTRQEIERLLDNLPEPEPEELATGLQGMRSALSRIRKVMLPLAKGLPYPVGGRRRIIAPEREGAICRRIAQLQAEGVELKQAQKRVAASEAVSLRTVQRIWAARRQRTGTPV